MGIARDHLDARTESVLLRLQGAATLEEASDKMNASLNVKTDHVSEQVDNLTVRLAQMLSTRLDHATEEVADRTLALGENLARRIDEITSNLLRSTATFTQRTFEGRVTLGAGPWQHVGFADDSLGSRYAIVSTAEGSSTLYARTYTVAGGASEIMRNIIAERALGMPRERRG